MVDLIRAERGAGWPSAGRGSVASALTRVDRWSEREDAAFEALYREHHQTVRTVLRARCPDWHLVDDVVHDTFLAAHLKWPTISQHARPGAWLIKTANYILVSALRRADRHRLTGEGPAIAEDGEQLFGPTDAATALSRLLLQLPQREAQAVLLPAYGFSARDAAMILGITVNTFYKYRADGKRKLAELVGRPDDEGSAQ